MMHTSKLKKVKNRNEKSRTSKHQKVAPVAPPSEWDLTITWDPTGMDEDSRHQNGTDKEFDTHSLRAASFAYVRSPRRPRSNPSS